MASLVICSFSRFGFIMQTDRQTDRHTQRCQLMANALLPWLTSTRVIINCIIYTRKFTSYSSHENGLDGFPFDYSSLYIHFNTIPPCPSQTGEGTTVMEEKWRESTFHVGNWCRVSEARRTLQPVLKTSSETHHFLTSNRKGTSLCFLSALRRQYTATYGSVQICIQ